jgi:ABC-type phosphate transport system ATPase subunit
VKSRLQEPAYNLSGGQQSSVHRARRHRPGTAPLRRTTSALDPIAGLDLERSMT